DGDGTGGVGGGDDELEVGPAKGGEVGGVKYNAAIPKDREFVGSSAIGTIEPEGEAVGDTVGGGGGGCQVTERIGGGKAGAERAGMDGGSVGEDGECRRVPGEGPIGEVAGFEAAVAEDGRDERQEGNAAVGGAAEVGDVDVIGADVGVGDGEQGVGGIGGERDGGASEIPLVREGRRAGGGDAEGGGITERCEDIGGLGSDLREERGLETVDGAEIADTAKESCAVEIAVAGIGGGVEGRGAVGAAEPDDRRPGAIGGDFVNAARAAGAALLGGAEEAAVAAGNEPGVGEGAGVVIVKGEDVAEGAIRGDGEDGAKGFGAAGEGSAVETSVGALEKTGDGVGAVEAVEGVE